MKDYISKFVMKGKNIYVAGGTGLIGTEICRALASAGGNVVILDINNKKGKEIEEEIIDSGHIAKYEYFNISNIESINDELERLTRLYGVMDVWINVTYPKTKDFGKKLEDIDIAYLRENIDMHLNSCLWACRKAALLMRENNKKGAIINFGSIYGVQANDLTIYEKTAMNGEIVYCAIKAGIINMTRYLASHFGPFGIRANSICPGGIFDNQDQTFVKNYENKVPLKRMGTPEDIASVALFLASDGAAYMTGCTVMVDGGWTII